VYHFPHHRYTGDPNQDPELSDTLLDPQMKSLTGYLIYLSALPFWIDRVLTTFRCASGYITEHWIKLEKSRAAVIYEARYLIALYTCVFTLSVIFRWNSIWWLWVFPSFLGQPFLRFYLIAEHVGCQNGANMMLNTRTVYTTWLYRKTRLEYAIPQ